MKAYLRAAVSHLPSRIETNEELQREFKDWNMARVGSKTGILQRHVAAEDETALDLACLAAQRLFSERHCPTSGIDFVIFCTQTPDYFLPTGACVIQDRLGLPKTCGALDINLGCSGYIYGLSLAKGLIESGQCKNVLLLTGDTYTKMIEPSDGKVRVLFGDGAAASWISAVPDPEGGGYELGISTFGTDGSGAEHLIAREGGFRSSKLSGPCLSMNGPEVFSFTIREVPGCFEALLKAGGLTIEDVDLVVPHQANAYMLKHLREKIGVPEDKFVVDLASVGNTVSSSIPIALEASGSLGSPAGAGVVVLLGFGVGYSWGAMILRR